MPKMKTRRSAAKRFRKTGTGLLVSHSAFRRHMLECKSRNRKRQLMGNNIVESANVKQVARMLATGAKSPGK
ncbi:MAG TPA: 50S ribosomal protein L35 [bacterium]|jgi:large subunit ribosomal protein L35